MPARLYIVFSAPPEGVSQRDYDQWYTQHASENIETPGLLSVTRYAVAPVVVGRRTAPGEFELNTDALPYDHAAIYEFEGELGDVRKRLLDRVARGEIYQPEWFDRIGWMNWQFTPIGDPVMPRASGG
jgi:hypothetical protein